MQRGVVGLALLGLLSCSLTNPRTKELSVEGQAAVAGRQAVAALGAAANGVDTLITSDVLTREQGTAVLVRLRAVGVELGRLGDILAIVDTTRDATAKQTATRQAAEIIRGVQRAILDAVVPIGTEAGRQRMAGILGPITDALVAISLTLQGSGGDMVRAPDPIGWPALDWRTA